MDARAWTSLARVLAAQGRYAEALRWINAVAARYPQDVDVALLKIRVLSWSGKLRAARSDLQALPETARRSAEALKLAGNLAFRSGDNAAVVGAYSAYLHGISNDADIIRRRGIAYQRLSRIDAARADFTTACDLTGKTGPACALLSDLERSQSRFSLLVRPAGRFVIGGRDEWQFDGEVRAQLLRTLLLGARIELRNRSFGDDSLTDTFVRFFSTYQHRSRWLLSVGGGATIDPSFSPSWTVEIEPGYGFPFGLEAYAKYWYLKFNDKGTHVLSPAVVYSWRQWVLYLRYFLAIDDVRGVGHHVLGRISRSFQSWQIYGGIGGGNRSDFIEPRAADVDDRPVERSLVVIAGVMRDFGWRQWVQLGYLARREKAGAQTYAEHQLGATYGVRF